MSKIFKNMLPYWKGLIIVVALLVVQAWCDLSLPAYTSDIIDVGIQNKGVGHVMPEAVTENEYNLAQLFMTDSEKTIWQESYDSDNGIYRCNVKSEKKLSSYDDELVLPLIINNQMADEEKQKLLAMSQAGMLSDEMVSQIREKAEETVWEDVQETIETPVNEEADVEEAEETDEVQNAEEEVNEQDAVDEIIEEIESSGKKSIGSLNEVEEETVSEEEAKAALDAFSSDEITPIEDTGAIPEIDDEPEIDEKPQPFENYFHVNREDPHNTDETISLIPEDDEDEDEEDNKKFKGFFKKKK